MTDTKIAASPLNPEARAFATFTVGDIEVFQIFEGAAARDLDPGFFTNVPVETVEAVLDEAGFAPGKIPNTYTVTVLRLGGRLIMIDSGFGEQGRPRSGMLDANMRAAGLDPAELTAIVVTHCHPDHIFGLMGPENAQVYPHLPIYVPAAEYRYWTQAQDIAPSRMALAERIRATLPHWPNIVRYGADEEVLPGIRSIASYGHSAGHTSLLVSSGAARLCVMGDVTNIPFFNMHHPQWRLAADDDPEMAATTRRRMLDWAADEGLLCTGYHWGMPGIGRIRRAGGGYRLEAPDMS